MLWLACHNPEIDWRIREVKMTRYLEECRKQQRPKQEKPGWQKQKKEKRKEESGRKQEERKEKQKKEKKKPKKKQRIEVRKVVKEWKIWDEEEKAAKSEKEAKRLVPAKFYKWIHIFSKKASKQISTKKLQNHTIDMKESITNELLTGCDA